MAIDKGEKCVAGVGRTPTITIRPSDNHWIIDGVDSGVSATTDGTIKYETDKTLKVSNTPADAKIVGDKINSLKEETASLKERFDALGLYVDADGDICQKEE